MVIQEREIGILSFLLRYKYLETGQIKTHFFNHQTKANMHRVLSRLAEAKLIEKRVFPKTTKLSMGYLVHLTEKGAKTLAYHFGVSPKEIGFKRITNPIQTINRFYHRKRMIDFWIKLDRELEPKEELENLELSYIITDTERENREGKLVAKTHIQISEKIAIVPDIIFKIRNTQQNFEGIFFVEIDAGTETIGGQFIIMKPSMILDKFEKYKRLCQKGSDSWKTVAKSDEQFRVLFITETSTHIKNIQKKAIGIIPEPFFPLYLFTTHDTIQEQGILGENIWTNLGGKQESLA